MANKVSAKIELQKVEFSLMLRIFLEMNMLLPAP